MMGIVALLTIPLMGLAFMLGHELGDSKGERKGYNRGFRAAKKIFNPRREGRL